MKLHLKKISVNKTFSRETTNFRADVFYGPKKICHAFNDGNGGETDLMPISDNYALFKEVMELHKHMEPWKFTYRNEEYSIPMTLELAINNLVSDHIQEDYRKKSMTQLDKLILKGLVYKHQESDTEYQTITWGEPGKWPIELMLKNKIMKEKLLTRLTELRCQKKIIFNTNLANY